MDSKLFRLKLIHTIIWLCFVTVILYILVVAILDRITLITYIAIGTIFLEGIILMIFNWKCPLTLIGKNYTDNHEVGFDIFLPQWLAKHNKSIFTVLFVIELVLVLYRILI